MQQLEGDRDAVSLLYHRIVLDPRHRNSAILDLSEISSRKFTQWSMGSLRLLNPHHPGLGVTPTFNRVRREDRVKLGYFCC